MHRQVNAIAGRLSLRPPQRQSLEILDRVTEIVPPRKDTDLAAALSILQSEYPSVTDFEREFPSLCFALATGVGKTRLMGAFISYLFLARGLSNFFVLAPNLTIYNKLIADFTPNTPKYVFKGISEFAVEAPIIVTGDNFEQGTGVRSGRLPGLDTGIIINIFNISKINSEVRGGRSPRIKRQNENLYEPYFEYLSSLEDLVLLMDESHRYRASAGVRAINELKPVLGLELTATPFVETNRGPVPFRNVIYDYPLGQAMEDGFVKEPAVVTRKDFNPRGMSPDEIERLKLEDGVRLHESVKVDLETYARETGNPIVKPFLLVIARDTRHASQLMASVESEAFFEGRYKGRVIQVDSSKTGVEEDEMVERLLKVEHTEEPTEIVIHVNMLKEGWDVTNLYTIVPLRAANARILIEQSIGRGLRLPYGKRTGVMTVDRLNIVAHDRFQEIIDEANRPGSVIRMKQVILDPAQFQQRTVTVVSAPQLETQLGLVPTQPSDGSVTLTIETSEPPMFSSPEEREIARLTYNAIRKLENQPEIAPGVASLARPDMQAELAREVARQYRPVQLALEGTTELPDIAAIVAKTTELVIQQTIDIPRILVVPTEDVTSGFRPFTLNVDGLRYQPPSEELWIQHLQTNRRETISLSKAGIEEKRLEDYIVSGLVDFDDVSYDENADLLYDLAGQAVRHFLRYLSEEDTRRVLQLNQRVIARFIHAQMHEHFQEISVDYEVRISKGFTDLKPSAYTASATEPPQNYRVPPPDRNSIAKYLFGGFQRCLYTVQKFQSDPERKLAVILERDSLKWFRPAKGQFQIFYKLGPDHHEYQPDFVAETSDTIYMLEPKRSTEMSDVEVLAKRDAAVKWCKHASDHSETYGGKPWKYLLIPHDVIAENMTLAVLANIYVQ
jgi:type III restriction enzyme